jgi:hypothetical protein
VAGVGAGLSQRSDGSFGRHVFAISISALAGSFDALSDLEAFPIEQHVASKLTDTGEISPGCALPIGKTPIALALIISEGGVNTVERPLGKLHSFDDCQRSPRLSSITIRFPNLGRRAVAERRGGGSFRAGKHARREFVSKFRAIAK